MRSCDEKNDPCAGILDGVQELFRAQVLFGRELFRLVVDGARGAGDQLRRLPSMTNTRSCCEIPEPCWMPESLGHITCELAASETGKICLVITNEDYKATNYQVVAVGPTASAVTFSKSSFPLASKQQTAITAVYTMPDSKRAPNEGCGPCVEHQVVLWVLGCKNHYLRWTFKERACGRPCCHEVQVHDRPNYVLHWYDHFYKQRPCFGPLTAPNRGGNP